MTLRDVAAALARTGRFDQALQVAPSISASDEPRARVLAPEARAQALMMVAEAAVEAGERALAVDVIEEARRVEGQIPVMFIPGWAADLLARLGRFDAALAAAEAIDDPARRSVALHAIVRALTAAGPEDPATFPERIAQALALTQKISDLAVRAQAIALVATARARVGQDAEADKLFADAWQMAGRVQRVNDQRERVQPRS
jgi:tetratricopeptide (TPR) repeat protein